VQFPPERRRPTDSLEWSRTFGILSISRLTLYASGIPYGLVANLIDEDIQAIADTACELVVSEPIEKVVEFVTRLYLAEKGESSPGLRVRSFTDVQTSETEQ
jgi:hypothetical protein